MDAELPVQLEEVREAENSPFPQCSSTLALVGVGLFFSLAGVLSPKTRACRSEAAQEVSPRMEER